MSIAKRFNKLFGIQMNIEEERQKFVNRINQTVFEYIDSDRNVRHYYNEIFNILCFELGKNANDLSKKHYRSFSSYERVEPEIRILTQNNFTETLRVLCILYGIYKQHKYEITDIHKRIDECISSAIEYSACDLGIRWKDGLFYPSGAEELDKPLIEEPLVWLDKYPKERKDYKRAIECFLEGKHLGDVIKNCYLVVEGVTRTILGNDKTLDNNKDALLAHVGLSDGWKSILGAYIKYAHDFRHASEDRYTASKEEAEAFLYMTGLIIRLLVTKQ
ncbi:MAG: hypothetical protein ABII09_12560 [Planctomycetota bacterium]